MKRNDWLYTILLMVAATAAAFLLFHLVPENMANIVLVYILALVLVARFTNGYRYGVIASLFCVVVINYCFTYPYFALNFTLTGYPITFIELLSISLIISTMTSHMTQQSRVLAEREHQLMEAEKEKMRANLLRAISHDLRTPLTGIIGTASACIEDDASLLPTERLEMLEHIKEDSDWLLNMVNNLLTVTRIQEENASVHKCEEIVEEVIEESITRLKKRFSEADIRVQIPEEPICIPMDAILIEQVIINLLENALVHAESIEPIELDVRETDQEVVFCVRDYGIGIKDQETIFDGVPMDAAPSSDSHRGMGIGLTICRTIVRAHGGMIVARNHDRGAEFIFTLPREDINHETIISNSDH